MKNINFEQLVTDLGLNRPFVKGQTIPINNCWHFSTDGNAIDCLFYDDGDFIAGMNRIYITVRGYNVIILAFSLMDTHIHFVLYGEFDECNHFMHEYVRRTSIFIAKKHGENNKLDGVPIDYQRVDNDYYLKTVICYTVKNAPMAGIPFNALDYPWSSGPLYFKKAGYWSSPSWQGEENNLSDSGIMGTQTLRRVLRTRDLPEKNLRMAGSLIFPGEYVAYELVERLFRTTKSFNYFLCRTKEEEVDSKGGTISHLSVPMQEMRQHKNELCLELFNPASIKTLNTSQRLILARSLRSRFNSSIKQIARLCGLVYNEVKDII